MEYSYKIWKDNGIIQSYAEAPVKIQSHTEAPVKVFMFEIRTKFKIKRKLEDEDEDSYDCEMIESESLSAILSVDQSRDFYQQQFAHITYRLNEYSMPDDKIQSLIHDALDFAEQVVAVDPSAPVIPIAVNVKVCTVQLDGETVDDAMDRSVRPECLAPLDLVRTIQKKDESCHRRQRLHDFLLFGLPRVIKGQGEGFDRMDACLICMGGPTDGVPVTWLPACRHAFHRHCVVRWLMERQSCPLCRQEVVVEKVRELKSCYIRCDNQTLPQPNYGIGPGPSKEVVVHEENMPTPRRPSKRKRQPSSWLKDYYLTC